MSTTFAAFDDEVTERLDYVLSKYIVDLETVASSYSDHVRVDTALAIFTAACRIAEIGIDAGGRDMFGDIIANIAAYPPAKRIK